jgi:hypothetical protein
VFCEIRHGEIGVAGTKKLTIIQSGGLHEN